MSYPSTRVIDRDRVRDKIAFLRRNLELLHALARTPDGAFTERSAEFHAAVRLLGGSGVIPPDFLDKVRSMVRFRNRAVHLYGDVDA
jgi:hypothetical protein